MIVLVHKDNEVVSVFDYHSKKALDFSDGNLVATFFEIAKTHKVLNNLDIDYKNISLENLIAKSNIFASLEISM